MNRKQFSKAWHSLEKLKEPHLQTLSQLTAMQSLLCDAVGKDSEPQAFCEACGCPFFEGDDYMYDADSGIANCFQLFGTAEAPCWQTEME